jgi:AraC family transcriptional regulator of arabinose operon
MPSAEDSKIKIKEGFVGQKMIVLPPNVRKSFTGNALISSFYLTDIGYYPRASHHDRERRTGAHEYILLYCVDGEGEISMNHQHHKLKPNTFFFIPKETAHRYKSSATNPWSIYWAHFRGTNAEALYNRFLENGQAEVKEVPYDESRIKVFEQLFSILDYSFNTKELESVNINLQQFIASLVYYKQINPFTFDTDSISISIAYMKKNLDKKIKMETFADHLGISVSHYIRVFRNKTGSSPINYFNHLKIQQSCQYLYFTDRSVKEIAVSLGFDDQYYFSRLFSKLIGFSPSNYRKKHKK